MLPSPYAQLAARPASPATPPPAPAARPLPPSPYQPLDRPLMDADSVGAPKNDTELKALVTRSKAALDHQTALHRTAHPAVQQTFAKARQQHVDAVVGAVHKYHAQRGTAFSGQLIDAIHSDPSIKTIHPKPK